MIPVIEKEQWDIYDMHRVKTGRIMNRGETNRPGDYHIVVHVCIFNSKNEILIQQRAHCKAGWPDKWDFSMGGHTIAGETSQQGAMRELHEELGLNINLSRELPYFTVNFSDGFDDFFLIQKDIDIAALTLQKEEVQNVAWASKENIRAMIQNGTFIDYHDGLLDLLYAMKQCRGTHASSGTHEAKQVI